MLKFTAGRMRSRCFAALAMVAVSCALFFVPDARAADIGKTKLVKASPVVPPVPERAPAPPPVAFGPPPPPSWAPEQAEAAVAECKQLLEGKAIDYELLEPIRESACGIAAPVKLKALKSDPPMEFLPPVIVTCKQAVALNQWFSDHVQPAAQKILKTAVVRAQVMSSYHCRTRYNNPSQPISNHALGEAVDIGGFVTAKGERIGVEQFWPKPPPPPPPPAPPPAVAAPVKEKPRPAAMREENGEDADDAEAPPEAGGEEDAPAPPPETRQPVPPKITAAALTPPKPAKPPVEDPRGVFLKTVHGGACSVFGTILGPEANEAHRNHFHLDVQQRRHVLCDHSGAGKNTAGRNMAMPGREARKPGADRSREQGPPQAAKTVTLVSSKGGRLDKARPEKTDDGRK